MTLNQELHVVTSESGPHSPFQPASYQSFTVGLRHERTMFRTSDDSHIASRFAPWRIRRAQRKMALYLFPHGSQVFVRFRKNFLLRDLTHLYSLIQSI